MIARGTENIKTIKNGIGGESIFAVTNDHAMTNAKAKSNLDFQPLVTLK